MEEKLLEWIRENADTEFGRLHRFGGIHSIADYQSYVPISDYSDYEDAIRRMYAGKTNVLTAYPVYCFVITSGSVGKPKRIPLTREGLRPFERIYGNVMNQIGGRSGKHIHLSVFPIDPNGRGREMMLSSAAYQYICEKKLLDPECYVGGKEYLFSKETENSVYIKLWCALGEENLLSIQSIFLYDVLLFFAYLREHGMEMLEAMETGIIPSEIRLAKERKKQLLTVFRPSKERIQFLKQEFRHGWEAIAPRIWKQLRMISGIGGSFFCSREKLLRQYTGSVSWQYFLYGSSECLTAYAEGLENPYYTLMPESGFYEFLDQDTGKVYTMQEVKENQQYELLITNRSGLYRYRQGDLVRIKGFRHGVPVLEILGRIHQVLNVAGEKMSASLLEAAVLRFSEEQGMICNDYAVAVRDSGFPMGYLIYIEPEKGPMRESVNEMCHTFDRVLREVNSDYDDLRNLEKLAMPQVICLRKGELERRKKYWNTSQNKPGQPILQQPFGV